jgi:hypothetical protein
LLEIGRFLGPVGALALQGRVRGVMIGWLSGRLFRWTPARLHISIVGHQDKRVRPSLPSWVRQPRRRARSRTALADTLNRSPALA